MGNNAKVNYKLNYTFVMIILLQLSLALYFNLLKVDLFIDEYFTFNFANSNYQPLLYDCSSFTNRWLGPEFWHKLLTVQLGERFNYGAVIFNTAQDVHPPVYYLIIHTICSFFPDCFSEWFGLIPNICFFIAIQYILWQLGKNFLGNNIDALAPCLIYGFSMGFVNNVILFRMYMLLALIALLYFWSFIKYLENWKKKYLYWLFALNVIGFLTHYYFLVYAAISYVFFCVVLMREKRYREIGYITIGNIASLLVSIALFPACLQHILGAGINSYRGNQAIAGFFSFGNLQEIILYYLGITFDEAIIGVTVLVTPLLVGWLLGKKYLCNLMGSNNKLLIMGETVVIFIIINILIRTNPFRDTRYFFFIYPILVLCLCYYGYFFTAKCYGLWKIFVVLTVTLQLFTFYNFKGSIVRYGGNENVSRIENRWLKESSLPCLGILADKHTEPIVYNIGVFKRAAKTYLVLQKDLDNLKLDLGNKAIVYIADGVDKAKVTAKMEGLGYQEISALPSERLSMGTNYLFSR